MRQVWAENVRFGIDHYGNPYLFDYFLIISNEDFVLSSYTDVGSIVSDICQGLDGTETGHSYTGTLTIMEDDDGELYRFSKVNEIVVAEFR